MCAHPGCDRRRSPKAGGGLCGLHYQRLRTTVDMSKPAPSHWGGVVCSFANCDRPAACRELCRTHYAQQRSGRPLKPIARRYTPGLPPGRECIAPGCAELREGRGYCAGHYNVLLRFNLAPELYDAMLAAQNGVCRLCLEPCASGRRLAVDHDHETGRIRALLCSNCNRGVGLLRDRPWLLERAATYLRTAGDPDGA